MPRNRFGATRKPAQTVLLDRRRVPLTIWRAVPERRPPGKWDWIRFATSQCQVDAERLPVCRHPKNRQAFPDELTTKRARFLLPRNGLNHRLSRWPANRRDD